MTGLDFSVLTDNKSTAAELIALQTSHCAKSGINVHSISVNICNIKILQIKIAGSR
jgi:hypothetical protein